MPRKCANGNVSVLSAKNPENGSPPAKIARLANPTTFYQFEIVSDGVDSGMQVKHEAKGREYQVAGPDVRFHYTKGPLPALKVTAIARKARFVGQAVLEVHIPLETAIEVLVRASTIIRKAIKSSNVTDIGTNFFPSSRGQGPDKTSCITIYQGESNQVPLSSFPLGTECDAYMFPSTLSFNKGKRLAKCQLRLVPLTFLGESSCAARLFQEGHDAFMEVPSSEMLLLGAGFLEKWRSTRDSDESADGDDDDIFA